MSRYILFEHKTLAGDMKIQPIPKHYRNDSNVVFVFDVKLNQAIKQWKVRLNNYKGIRFLRERSEHPAPNDRKRWKKVRAEQNRLRRERRATG